MEIKYHGHSCFELSEGETTVLVTEMASTSSGVVVIAMNPSSDRRPA